MIDIPQFSVIQRLDHLDDGLEQLLPPGFSFSPQRLFFHHIRLLFGYRLSALDYRTYVLISQLLFSWYIVPIILCGPIYGALV